MDAELKSLRIDRSKKAQKSSRWATVWIVTGVRSAGAGRRGTLRLRRDESRHRRRRAARARLYRRGGRAARRGDPQRDRLHGRGAPHRAGVESGGQGVLDRRGEGRSSEAGSSPGAPGRRRVSRASFSRPRAIWRICKPSWTSCRTVRGRKRSPRPRPIWTARKPIW